MVDSLIPKESQAETFRDLHLEHLNKVCKSCIRDLGANNSTGNITTISKSIGTVDAIVTKFDTENEISTYMSHHGVACKTDDVKMIYNELMKYDVLVPQSKRQYSYFKKPKDLLSSADEDKLIEYIKKKLY